MRHTCLSGDLVQRIGHFFRGGPQLFPYRSVFRLEKTGENQFLHGVHSDVQFFEQTDNRFGNDYGIAYFPKPPHFPGEVKLGFG
ncbi:MAG: hypothetical protein RBT20_05725, partial [Syntrophales bacterium]|nr:hypothetical protein [Syntrophales bacterium]